MLLKIKCPDCDTEGTISLLEADYNGPYRCWKCKKLFMIVLEGNELKSCEPLSDESLQKLQEIEALKKKFKRD
jgi:DNA-directed RNA polymerase subunit RPC12/RpoP